MLVTLLTSDLGIVRARAQGLRKPGAKMASALLTFVESDLVLVRGSEGWRVTNAIELKNWARALTSSAKVRAGRVVGLLLRLVAGEETDETLFPVFTGLLEALTEDESLHDAAECLAALRILRALGLDAGEVPGAALVSYDPALLSQVADTRSVLVARINRGIAASGL